jgi:hypothetical protein
MAHQLALFCIGQRWVAEPTLLDAVARHVTCNSTAQTRAACDTLTRLEGRQKLECYGMTYCLNEGAQAQARGLEHTAQMAACQAAAAVSSTSGVPPEHKRGQRTCIAVALAKSLPGGTPVVPGNIEAQSPRLSVRHCAQPRELLAQLRGSLCNLGAGCLHFWCGCRAGAARLAGCAVRTERFVQRENGLHRDQIT